MWSEWTPRRVEKEIANYPRICELVHDAAVSASIPEDPGQGLPLEFTYTGSLLEHQVEIKTDLENAVCRLPLRLIVPATLIWFGECTRGNTACLLGCSSSLVEKLVPARNPDTAAWYAIKTVLVRGHYQPRIHDGHLHVNSMDRLAAWMTLVYRVWPHAHQDVGLIVDCLLTGQWTLRQHALHWLSQALSRHRHVWEKKCGIKEH